MDSTGKITGNHAGPVFRRGILFSLVIIFLNGMEAPASPPQEVQQELPAPAREVENGSVSNQPLKFLDDVQATVRHSMAHSAWWFDGFFGDEREERDIEDSSLKLKTEFFWKESGELDFRQRVRINLDLPRLKEKLKLIFTTEREGEMYAQGGGSVSLEAEDTSTRSFFRWVGKASKQYNLHLDVGVRFRDGLQSFGELYGRRSVNLNETWAAHFREAIFLVQSEGLGETTRVDFEKKYSPTCFLRFASEGTVAEESRGLEWRQDVTFFREIGVRKAVSLNAGVFGITQPSFVTERYRLAFRYRQSVFRPWLFMEIEPEVNWHNESDWDAVPQINFRCEMIFGGK